jgi:hypothetical protein
MDPMVDFQIGRLLEIDVIWVEPSRMRRFSVRAKRKERTSLMREELKNQGIMNACRTL